MQSSCVLFEGIVSRQRELYARAGEIVEEQAAMDPLISPRKGPNKGTTDGALSGSGTAGGRFALSPGAIDQTFIFAMIWGLGGGLTGDPALAFDVYVRDLVQVSDCPSVIEETTSALLSKLSRDLTCGRAQTTRHFIFARPSAIAYLGFLVSQVFVEMPWINYGRLLYR